MELRLSKFHGALFRVKITPLSNGSFVATLEESSGGNGSAYGAEVTARPYNDEGALIYVVAVICIYGLSILLMIGSVIKKNKTDHGLSKYMNDIDKVQRIERRQEKLKTRIAMQKREKSKQSQPSALGTEGAKPQGTAGHLTECTNLLPQSYDVVKSVADAAFVKPRVYTSKENVGVEEHSDSAPVLGPSVFVDISSHQPEEGGSGMNLATSRPNREVRAPSPSVLNTVLEELDEEAV